MPTPLTRRPDDLVSRLLAAYEDHGTLPLFRGGDHGDGDPPAGDPPGGDEKPDPRDQLKANPDLQAFVNDLIASERRRTEDKLTADAEAKAKADREAREREEAEKRGDFEKVKQDYETRITSLETDKGTVETRLKQYEDLVRKDVEAQWGEIPEEVRETFTGDDDDVLAKKDHIVRNKKIIERLTAPGATEHGNGPNPPAGKPITEDAKSPVTGRSILS